MVRLLDDTIDESELSATRTGVPRADLIPVLEKLVERLDSGKFTIIEVDDKKDAERTGESLRNQLRLRGFRVRKHTAVKEVQMKNPRGKILKDEDGNPMTETKFYLYMHAYSPVTEPESEVSENGTNGKPARKSRPSKKAKGPDKGE